jgi:guanylate kinase
MHKGMLIVISAPAGCGKDTIVEALFENYPELELFYSVSTTTRDIREGEESGKHYCFTDRVTFEQFIKQGEFIEYTEYCGNYYGTSKQTVTNALKKGKNVLLKIESEGAENIKKMFADALLIFILPPSMEELRRRLETRSTEDESAIEKRLEKAREELKLTDKYDFCVVNDDLHSAVEKIAEIISNRIKKRNEFFNGKF